jgi:hypothetical protein
MPIKFDGKKFAKWKMAATYLMRKKGWSRERANAYVAGIENRQKGK